MKSIPLLITGGLILTLIYLVYFHIPPEKNDPEYLFWGKLHLILSTFPAIIYFNGDTRKHTYPFIAFVSLFQIVAFGLPVFFIRTNSFQMNELLNLESMKIAFWGLLIFYSTFFVLHKYLFQKINSFRPIPDNLNPLYYNTMVSSVLLIYLSSVFFEFGAIQQLANFSLYVYVGFTFSKVLRRTASVWESSIFFGVVGFEFIRRVTSGLVAELAVFILFLCLVIMLEGSKKYLIAVLFIPFAIFYSLFSSVKGTYRQKIWFENTEMSYEEKVSLITDLLEHQETKVHFDDKEGKDNFLWRFSYPMAAFSMVVTKTPAFVPYWNGESYLPLFTKFIPRAVWPTKPEENMGQRFGRAYKVIKENDTGTSINTPVLTEIYMNFGLMGFYIGMFVLGIFFIFLDKFFNSKSVSYYNQIVNMAIIFPLMIMESNFSLTYGNLFLICICLYLIFRSLKK